MASSSIVYSLGALGAGISAGNMAYSKLSKHLQVGFRTAPVLPPFRLNDLPMELILRILIFATASSAPTYASLLLVSRRTRDLVYAECLSWLPVILKEPHHLRSFRAFLSANPDAGARVSHLWIVATADAYEERVLGGAIINACPNVCSLACRVNALAESVCSTQPFMHSQCIDLTLMDNFIQWPRVFRTPNAARFLNQLTHLRLASLSFGVPEPSIQFTRLTHLSSVGRSFTDFDDIVAKALRGCSEQHMFCPVLKQVMITLHRSVMGDTTDAFSESDFDPRLFIVHCPPNWNERDNWEQSISGGGAWRDAVAAGETRLLGSRSRKPANGKSTTF